MKKIWVSTVFLSVFCFFVLSLFTPRGGLRAEETAAPQAGEEPAAVKKANPPPISSEELLRMARKAARERNLDRLNEIVQQTLDLYGAEADAMQKGLTGLPPRDKVKEYGALNDVATVMFTRAEAVMHQGLSEEALRLFDEIIRRYPSAQAWDPLGWYWSVKEKSEASQCVIRGDCTEIDDAEPQKPTPRLYPKLAFPGTSGIVDYSKYGEFLNVGTKDYVYNVTDPVGLSAAVGEGIFPNTGAVRKDPDYKKLKKEGRLKGSYWDALRSTDLEAAFYQWALAPEPWGIRLFNLGIVFEESGMLVEALKAYHALVVHFPKTIGWTYWQTPWYPAQAAVAKIKHIVRSHPELNMQVKWMKIEVKNGFDNDIHNDVVVTYPGIIYQKTWWDQLLERLNLVKNTVPLGKEKRRLGSGRVQLVQYENGHWQMLVDGQPFVIKGMTYSPTKIGQSPSDGTLVSWMYEDTNHNGKADGPYDSWVDRNGNNEQDPDEPVVGDFQLMKEMGVNVIRLYHQSFAINKELLRQMHKDYGFYVIMGDFLGKYAFGSGAEWQEGTDYENEEQRRRMMESVRKMVMEYKDEPYLLLWVLGNENNYGVACNANEKPAVYYEFANEVAQMIKSLDPNHPVALCNGDTLFLDIYARYAKDIDIFAANVYRGNYGFGAFWEQVRGATDKPAFITEYGAPAFAKHLTLDEAETAQEDYHKGNWGDIEENLAGKADGSGNALGGVVFEWMDEWWKNYEPYYHDKKSDAIGPFFGGYYYEEWFGIASQGNGQKSPFLRKLRKSYSAYQEMWNH